MWVTNSNTQFKSIKLKLEKSNKRLFVQLFSETLMDYKPLHSLCTNDEKL